MSSEKRILVITPRFPYPEAGACEQDRAESLRQLRRLGYAVRVVGKYFAWQDKNEIIAFWQKEEIDVTLVPYQYVNAAKEGKWEMGNGKWLFVLTHPWYLDGSTLEFADDVMQETVRAVADEFKPDIAWFDYTYLWPLYRIFQKRKIPIVTRSINFEAQHYLDEDGRSIGHCIKSLPKFLTEYITGRKSDIVFAITPKEERQYKKFFARRAVTLPLRALYNKLGTHVPRPTDQLQVFFSGSTYNVTHNYRALQMIIKDIAPRVEQQFGDRFIFHVTGAKFPDNLRQYVKGNVRYDGFVENMGHYLKNMDIALVPSLFGAGMQQKIFEPLARGFPTITHARGLAGYPFSPGNDVLTAETTEEFVATLGRLRSLAERERLSKNAKKVSQELFNRERMDGIAQRELAHLSPQKKSDVISLSQSCL